MTAAIGVVALEAALFYALLNGLNVVRGLPASDALQVIGIVPTQPPPPKKKPKPPPKPRTRSPAGAAAPPNLKATPTEIVRPPPPPIIFPPPPPVAAAPIAGTGAAPSAGAAPVRGPGTGAGGQGDGTGSGDGGNGTGSGGGRGRGKAPKHIHGKITNADYPAAAKAAGAQGGLWVRYTVLTNGRATNCRILRSSGTPSLDQTTCRLIEERFVFRPAKDERGRPVQADLVEEHAWIMDEKNPPPEPDEPDPD
jgi:protein TonB